MLFPLAPQNTYLGTQTKARRTVKLAAKFGTIAMAGSLLALSALGAARLDPAPLLPEPPPTNESSLLADGSSPTQQQAVSRNRSGSAPAANASGPASLLSQTREAFYSVPFDRSVYVLGSNQDSASAFVPVDPPQRRMKMSVRRHGVVKDDVGCTELAGSHEALHVPLL